MATEREKKRMEKLNTCIDEIKEMVCPAMKTPTKAKVLSVAIDRIQYLEKLTKELLSKENSMPSNSELFDQIIKPPPKSWGIKCEPKTNQNKITWQSTFTNETAVLENVPPKSCIFTHPLVNEPAVLENDIKIYNSEINHGYDQENMRDLSSNHENMNQLDLNIQTTQMYSHESLPAQEFLQLSGESYQGYTIFENYGTQAENFMNLFEDSYDEQSYFQE